MSTNSTETYLCDRNSRVQLCATNADRSNATVPGPPAPPAAERYSPAAATCVPYRPCHHEPASTCAADRDGANRRDEPSTCLNGSRMGGANTRPTCPCRASSQPTHAARHQPLRHPSTPRTSSTLLLCSSTLARLIALPHRARAHQTPRFRSGGVTKGEDPQCKAPRRGAVTPSCQSPH